MTARHRTYRDLVISPPDEGDIPGCLVGPGAAVADVREARLDGQLVGAYRIERLGETRFRVAAVVVVPVWRRRGFGTWLLRHAIGLAESRGARVIDAPPADAEAFFCASGFAAHCGAGMRLALTPE